MFLTPLSRRAPTARLRQVAIAQGALPVRSWEASSAKVVSRTWCRASINRSEGRRWAAPAPATLRAPAGETEPQEAEADGQVPLPAATVAAVRALVGAEHVPEFVGAAADREVAARRMDDLSDRPRAP